MIQSRSAAHAKAYFGDALARADYYISDQELPGFWGGKMALRLGLSGATGKDDFHALCENIHPRTGKRLTPRTKANRTAGYDINFHCPKSVSIVHALSPDDHILDAFRASVTETMQMIEADARTGVRTGGRSAERKTGALVWAHFTHQTARPVEGHAPDPHLHAHCFVFNATWDPVEARIKAGQFREINRDMPYYQALFQKTLADRLTALGYQVRATETSFEIDGVPQPVIDLFSKRTDRIGRVAKEKGITDPKELSALGARTRAKKQKGASMAELRQDWRDQIAALGPDQEIEMDAIVEPAPVKEGGALTQAWEQVAGRDADAMVPSAPMAQGRTLTEDWQKVAGRGQDAEPHAAPVKDGGALTRAWQQAARPAVPDEGGTWTRLWQRITGRGASRTIDAGQSATSAASQAPVREDAEGAQRGQQDTAPGPAQEAKTKAGAMKVPEAKAILRFGPAKHGPDLTAAQCLDYAVLHCFERASVVEDRRILARAFHRSIGAASVSIDDIDRRFAADPRIIHVKEHSRTLCTTKEVLAEERRMVALARAGQGVMIPLYATAPDIALIDPQQRAAVAHILTTGDRVSIVRGVAGAGKTTLMTEAVAQIERAGKTVTAVAPGAQASRGTLKEQGFKDATTVAALLENPRLQQALKNQVLWVDEAGRLGTQDMKALLDLTTRQNARLILGGDTRQHASVQRGDALRILNTVGGIKTAEVNKIYRQTSADYRDIVKDLSDGDVGRAFGRLDRLGWIKEIAPDYSTENRADNGLTSAFNTHAAADTVTHAFNRHAAPGRSQEIETDHAGDGQGIDAADESQDLRAALVQDCLAVLARGKSALVVSPTHAQGEKITDAIRAALRETGVLGKQEIEAVQFKNRNLTEAEKSDPRQFKPGHIVQFNQNAPGIQRGSQWTVTHATATGVQITDAHGATRPLPIDKRGCYEVFHRGTLRLSKGDSVLITKNGFDADHKRLNNGDILTVVSVSKRGGIVLQNDVSQATHRIDKTFGHLAHAHCVTSYAAQGKTVDEVFIFQPAATFPATDAKQFYVCVSRAHDRVHIYTDDKEELLYHAQRLRERQSALELVGPTRTDMDRHKEAITRQRRADQSRERMTNRHTRERDDGPSL